MESGKAVTAESFAGSPVDRRSVEPPFCVQGLLDYVSARLELHGHEPRKQLSEYELFLEGCMEWQPSPPVATPESVIENHDSVTSITAQSILPTAHLPRIEQRITPSSKAIEPLVHSADEGNNENTRKRTRSAPKRNTPVKTGRISKAPSKRTHGMVTRSQSWSRRSERMCRGTRRPTELVEKSAVVNNNRSTTQISSTSKPRATASKRKNARSGPAQTTTVQSGGVKKSQSKPRKQRR